jgi:uncharacterized protein YoxC
VFKFLTTTQRVIFCVALTNFLLFSFMYFISYEYEIKEHDFLILSAMAAIINIVWVWLLLKKSFNTIDTVTSNIKKLTNKNNNDIIKFQSSGNFKLQVDGHQKEVTDLVNAFNHLVEDIHEKAKQSKDIISDVNDSD